MSGFFFTFLAVIVASVGARDQVLVAQLATRQGKRPLLLLVALVSAALASSVAAWAGARVAAEIAPGARGLVAAGGLLLAGAEMLVLRPPRPPREPTRSLFAALVVLLAHQITDAARVLVLAFAVGTAAPLPAALGGAAGSAAALVAAWLQPGRIRRMRLGRRLIGAALIILGLVTGGIAID